MQDNYDTNERVLPRTARRGSSRLKRQQKLSSLTMRFPSWWAAICLLTAWICAGCRASEGNKSSNDKVDAAQVAPTAVRFDRIERVAFNQRAVELNQPIFWRTDDNGDGMLQPEELVVTWTHALPGRADFVDGKGQFTPRFNAIYEQMLRPDENGPAPPAEMKRREAVRSELSQGRPTLVESDFSRADEGDRALVAHLARVAVLIERIFAKQKGTAGMETKIPPGDAASAALFFRNQGPFCVAPKTEKDPDCHALPERTKPIFGLYPAPLQSDANFCEILRKQENAAALTDHFRVVVSGDKTAPFRSQKYSEAYREDMETIAGVLDAASVGLSDKEGALKKYLSAAAKSFRDNDWEPANEAWVAMGNGNSKYYLRVGPDETYYDPCGWKAGFALAFARINEESTEWRKKLEPIKQEMENEFASFAGKPYGVRQVAFKLPDFIDIVLNAGESRIPIGATAGQSLPNWGPVADKGGRTVTMTNLSNDPDSQHALQEQMRSLFCKATMATTSIDPKAGILGVVLHEVGHNLGPAHEYKVNGDVDDVIFGGPLAATLEELKAQTAALYWPARLLQKKLIDRTELERSRAAEIAWGFGQIAQGMYDSEGRPKNYAQLASIQLGVLRRAGVLEWKADQVAANEMDRGCFEIHGDKWQSAASDLVKRILRIKARGDLSAAELLKNEWVDGDGDWKGLTEVIAARWLRTTKASFVYSISGL